MTREMWLYYRGAMQGVDTILDQGRLGRMLNLQSFVVCALGTLSSMSCILCMHGGFVYCIQTVK